MLGGVAWNEVSGDPPAFDNLGYSGRSPTDAVGLAGLIGAKDETSFGELSMQVQTASVQLGYDLGKMSKGQKDAVIASAKDPVQGIFLAASYLSTGRDKIAPGVRARDLTTEQKQQIGAFYNGGPAWYKTNSGAINYGQRGLANGTKLLGNR